MNPRQIGLKNQRKSKQWILQNPDKYGITDEDRIQVAGLAHYQGDFFACKYNERIEKIDGKDVKLFDRAGWDIITMPDYSMLNVPPWTAAYSLVPLEKVVDYKPYMYLIQVKTNWDITPDHAEYLQHLIEFKVPFYVKKELHIWRDHVKVPFIINLNKVKQ